MGTSAPVIKARGAAITPEMENTIKLYLQANMPKLHDDVYLGLVFHMHDVHGGVWKSHLIRHHGQYIDGGFAVGSDYSVCIDIGNAGSFTRIFLWRSKSSDAKVDGK